MRYSKIIFFTLIILTGLVISYYKYFLHTYNQNIILSEEQEEYKRKPLDPGGVIIPHSNSLIYEKLNINNAIIENINFLSEPEEPIDLIFKSNLEDVIVFDSIDDILAKLNLYEDDEIIQNEYSNNDNSVNNVNNTANSSNISDKTNDSDINHNTNQTSSQLKIIKLSAENNRHYSFSTNSVDSSYKIQLSSAWSEKEAKIEWKKIQLRHAKYLKNKKLVIKKVRITNNKIIYLIMAGNYPSLNQAKLVCKKLTLSKQNCIVTK